MALTTRTEKAYARHIRLTLGFGRRQISRVFDEGGPDTKQPMWQPRKSSPTAIDALPSLLTIKSQDNATYRRYTREEGGCTNGVTRIDSAIDAS
jgi:hypothetical protein